MKGPESLHRCVVLQPPKAQICAELAGERISTTVYALVARPTAQRAMKVGPRLQPGFSLGYISNGTALTRRYLVAPCWKNTRSAGLEVLKGRQKSSYATPDKTA
jgi:hypothetical protein